MGRVSRSPHFFIKDENENYLEWARIEGVMWVGPRGAGPGPSRTRVRLGLE